MGILGHRRVFREVNGREVRKAQAKFFCTLFGGKYIWTVVLDKLQEVAEVGMNWRK